MKYDISKMVTDQTINEELDRLNENGRPIVGVTPIKGKLTERDKSIIVQPVYDTFEDRRVGVDAAAEYLDYRESRSPFTQFHVVFFLLFLTVASVAGFAFGTIYGEKSTPTQQTFVKY